jgi:hypothetical protein
MHGKFHFVLIYSFRQWLFWLRSYGLELVFKVNFVLLVYPIVVEFEVFLDVEVLGNGILLCLSEVGFKADMLNLFFAQIKILYQSQLL